MLVAALWPQGRKSREVTKGEQPGKAWYNIGVALIAGWEPADSEQERERGLNTLLKKQCR